MCCPYTPCTCMVYLPTFGWFLGHMLVNLPCMEHMGWFIVLASVNLTWQWLMSHECVEGHKKKNKNSWGGTAKPTNIAVIAAGPNWVLVGLHFWMMNSHKGIMLENHWFVWFWHFCSSLIQEIVSVCFLAVSSIIGICQNRQPPTTDLQHAYRLYCNNWAC